MSSLAAVVTTLEQATVAEKALSHQIIALCAQAADLANFTASESERFWGVGQRCKAMMGIATADEAAVEALHLEHESANRELAKAQDAEKTSREQLVAVVNDYQDLLTTWKPKGLIPSADEILAAVDLKNVAFDKASARIDRAMAWHKPRAKSQHPAPAPAALAAAPAPTTDHRAALDAAVKEGMLLLAGVFDLEKANHSDAVRNLAVLGSYNNYKRHVYPTLAAALDRLKRGTSDELTAEALRTGPLYVELFETFYALDDPTERDEQTALIMREIRAVR